MPTGCPLPFRDALRVAVDYAYDQGSEEIFVPILKTCGADVA